MNKTIKNTKDVLRRMEEILSGTETGEAGADRTAKPSLMERMRAGGKLAGMRK